MTATTAQRFFEEAARSFNRGDVARALSVATSGLLRFPQHPPLLTIAGIAQLQRGQIEIAESLLSTAHKIAPDCIDAIYNLGFIRECKGDVPGAISFYRNTLLRQPMHLPAMFNLGNALRACGDLAGAEEQYKKILNVGPHPQAFKNLGILALDDDRHIEAEEFFRSGLALTDDPDLEAYLGFSLLAQERFAEGWQYYEARLKAKPPKILPTLADKPSWDFKEVGTVLVWTEEGIGDVVMFASVLPNMLDCCNRILLVADPRLHPLFSRSFSSKISLYGTYTDVPIDEVDAQVALASCIGRYRKTIDQFAATSDGYLHADERRRKALQSKLTALAGGKRIVGISWSSINKETGPDRSIVLAQLMAMLSPEIYFLVNLQYGDISADVDGLTEGGARPYQEDSVDVFHDIDGLAALIEASDLVVSADNSTVHIAGALGVNQIILLPKPCSWRWGVERDTSLLYGKAKLLRQRRRGDWSCLSELPALMTQVLQ